MHPCLAHDPHESRLPGKAKQRLVRAHPLLCVAVEYRRIELCCPRCTPRSQGTQEPPESALELPADCLYSRRSCPRRLRAELRWPLRGLEGQSRSARGGQLPGKHPQENLAVGSPELVAPWCRSVKSRRSEWLRLHDEAL